MLRGRLSRHFVIPKRLGMSHLEENLALPRSIELLPREVGGLCGEGLGLGLNQSQIEMPVDREACIFLSLELRNGRFGLWRVLGNL